MSHDDHGNTPAAWTAVTVAMVGFVVAGVALMLSPINLPIMWVGLVIIVLAFPLFLAMRKMGYGG